MDVQHSRKIELKTECNDLEHTQTHSTKNIIKRPFDVAFLMLPDEKLKHKNPVKLQKSEVELCYRENNNDEDDEEIDIEEITTTSNRDYKIPQQHTSKYFTQKQQIFDDPKLIKSRNLSNELIRGKSVSPTSQKSAFTKVNVSNNLTTKTENMSPNNSLSLSPDISYQNSLSPSPPINRSCYQNFHSSMLSHNQFFKTHQYQATTNLLPENFHQQMQENPILLQQNYTKIRPVMYRPELAYNYQQFPNQEMLKIAPPDLKFPPDIRNPTAAILTSLLPPSLAALSLPAQNVCAKCNITFRMTSDLVYHMRSHHKNEASDAHKRRREDKLKCPVCAESFRERHHLTRHMTAHQDKDDDDKNVKKGNAVLGCKN